MFEFIGNLTKEDYLEYNEFHINNTKSIRNTIWPLRLLAPSVFIVFGVLIGGIRDMITIVIMTLLSIVWVITCPYLFNWTSKFKTKKMLNDKKNGDMFLLRNYKVSDQGILIKSPNTTSLYKWKTIVSFEEGVNQFYLYISSIQAIVIPKRFIKNKEDLLRFRVFVENQMS